MTRQEIRRTPRRNIVRLILSDAPEFYGRPAGLSFAGGLRLRLALERVYLYDATTTDAATTARLPREVVHRACRRYDRVLGRVLARR